MRREILALAGIGIGLMVIASCVKPEKRIPGTWTATSVKFDGQEEVTITDSDLDLTCGEVSASASVRITSLTVTFKEEGNYTMITTYLESGNYNSTLCGSYSGTSTEIDTTDGTWAVIGKDKLILKPSDSNQETECTIVKLKKKEMILSCPCVEDCDVDLLEDGDIDYILKEIEFTLEK